MHLYYPDLVAPLAQALKGLGDTADLMISFPETWSEADLAQLARAFPAAWLEPCLNRGRDVEPFLKLLGIA